MKKKKGMLLASEVLKIVLGVIGITLLIYLLVSLYFAKANTDNLIQAEATLERVSDIVKEFQFNPSFEGTITEVTPAKWKMFAYTGNEVKPDSCSGKDCICICDTYSRITGYFKKYAQERECNADGACLIVENLKDFGVIYITPVNAGGIDIVVKKDGNWVEVRQIGILMSS